jgi:SAM-dependent methyltransferase
VPVPVHVPVRFAADEAGGGAVPVGAEGADAGEPQPASGMSSAAVTSGARIFTRLQYRSDVREIFFSIHTDLPREGPGDRASTRRAFSLLSPLASAARILDVGCGPGQQTIDLAALHRGSIVALDTHRPYLDALHARCVAAGVAHRVSRLRASMLAVPLAGRSVDVIWAEGSIYIVGFERGLREWRPLLKPGGCVAATHLSWLSSDIPAEPRAFWARNYPAMTTIDANLAIARACGFEVAEHFTLPESAWWDEYYDPMEARLRVLRATHRGDDEALGIIASTQAQIDLFRRFAWSYGYVFYVLRLR